MEIDYSWLCWIMRSPLLLYSLGVCQLFLSVDVTGFHSSRVSLPKLVKWGGVHNSILTPSTDDRTSVVARGTNDFKPRLFQPAGFGIRRDFMRRWPYYRDGSDLTDGLNVQTLASILFLFFACLAPAVGFGSVCQIATMGQMGVLEMCASTALCGMMYALLAPQPMLLVGPMGPVLSYQITLYRLSQQWHLEFLPFNAAVGLWTSLFLFLCSYTSLCNLVQYLTRFTDEIFSVVVSTIFLLGAISDVSNTFSTANPVTALLTLTCCTLTFGIPTLLRLLPNKTSYFSAQTRKHLANFAPAIGVVCGSLVARAARLHWKVALPALDIPTKFATTVGRPWLVPMNQLPLWAWCAAALPALLATLLLFLDQTITARIVNHPRFKQVKGRDTDTVTDGMNGDMLVISALTALTSVLGLPWIVGATTRAAAHVRSLVLTDANGVVTGCLEQRLSGFAIHFLIGISILCSAPRILLRQVPLAALSGVFLYLGFSSLQGLQLWDRINNLFQDKSGSRQKPWEKLPRLQVAGFTVVQMFCVASMIRVAQSKFGVFSPLVIGLLPLVRMAMLKLCLIRDDEMKLLDGNE